MNKLNLTLHLTTTAILVVLCFRSCSHTSRLNNQEIINDFLTSSITEQHKTFQAWKTLYLLDQMTISNTIVTAFENHLKINHPAR